jgi:TolB-like protein/DNA-binding winged helix-turn-helix (wHTH) protein/Tfp pilus assembly protein PilF
MDQTPDPKPAIYVFGAFRLEPSRRLLEKSGLPVALSSRAFDVLVMLIEARERVVSRAEIMARVWQGVVVDEHNLSVQMSALRRALGDAGDEPAFIATVPGRGYRFVGVLEAPADAAPAAPAPAPPAAPRAVPRRARARWKIVLPVVLCGVAGAALLGIRLRHWGGPDTDAPRLSIVVMPFRDLSDDRSHAYLADAISDDLTTDLAHLPGSLVISRESADVYRGQTVAASTVGQALNVRYLLEGSLRAEDKTLRINAQLIDTGTGTHLWSEKFDTAAGGLGDTQAEIVNRVASALNVVLVEDAAARARRDRPHNPDALDLFYQARSRLDHAATPDDLTAAQALLETATRAQPDFIDALTELAWLLVRKTTSFDDPNDAADRAEATRVVSHALALAPDNPAALATRGRLLAAEGRYAEADAAFDAALATDPNNILALTGVAMSAWGAGAPEKVEAPLAAIMRLDPRGPATGRRYGLRGYAALFSSRYDQAVQFLLRADAQEPDVPVSADSVTPREVGRLFLIAAYQLQGNSTEAQRLYQAYRAAWPHRSVWRQMNICTKSQARMANFHKVEDALVEAGMPRFADEHEDDGVAPTTGTLEGGEYAPTPRAIPGGQVVDTAAVQRLIAAPAAPAIVDVGLGRAVIAGAVLLSDSDAAASRAVLESGPNGAPLKARAPNGVVVMGTGTFGTASYQAALHFIALGYKVFWYRGGEEAWARAGLPAEDQRVR